MSQLAGAVPRSGQFHSPGALVASHDMRRPAARSHYPTPLEALLQLQICNAFICNHGQHSSTVSDRSADCRLPLQWCFNFLETMVPKLDQNRYHRCAFKTEYEPIAPFLKKKMVPSK
jgi:hypothetical protein